MIEINLLQEEKQKRTPLIPRVDPTKPLLVMGLIVVVGAIALVNIYVAGQSSKVKNEINQIKRKMTAVAHVEGLKKSDELQASLDKLNRKAVIIDDLIKNRIHWSKKLAALRETLPDDIWLETIELENPKNPKDTQQTLRIEAATVHADRGFARSAETMESLKNATDFMAGLTGELEDRQASNEPWDDQAQNADMVSNIWRFSFVAKRQLPESELPQSLKKPTSGPTPTPAPKAAAKK
jgi:Tfp pilus assembly protein PilN